MKKTLLTSAAFLAASTALFAQSLSITAPGYGGAKLFDSTAGFTITGLAAAPGGDVFYIETDSAPPLAAAHSMLYRRSAGDSYAAATPLFDFGAKVFGSFVRWDSGRVFFGESSTGAVRLLKPDLSIDPLGMLAFNYDAAFSGGNLFIAHNPAGPFGSGSQVSRFDLPADGSGGLMLSAPDTIVDTPDDSSGPIAFDAAGNLFYGGSGAFGRPDLYRFTAAEVSSAFGGGPSQSLDPAHRFLANGSNAYLAIAPAGLWHTDFATLDLIDPVTAQDTAIGGNPNPYGIGQLDFADGLLYAAVTDSSFTHSSVFTVVPEPSSALLLTLGLAALTRGRGRRKD